MSTSTPTRSAPVRPPVRPSRLSSVKRMFLGRPLVTSQLEHERLSNTTALAVFSSDNMSSVAYATEEILRVLIPIAGLAAFSFVLPITFVIVGIEAVLVFSYRQTIKAYPSAGGAYIVTKDNFGLLPAQVAGVALLSDYVLTVAVSVAAGTQAVSSVAPVVHTYRIPVSLVFVWLVAYGNLLGVRESGRLFSVPTYAFIVSLYLTIGLGLFKVFAGQLHTLTPRDQSHALPLGASAIGIFIVLKAFASGGAALTGVEAISNGVPAFRKPEWKNARTTLVWMALILGVSFMGVSLLAQNLHVLPTEDESKSVLAQIGELVYGTTGVGHVFFLILQATTTLILILAANTSFADFPRLANFQAGDAFLPRQFTKRGHKLVFSNGVIALAVAASVLLVVFKASVTNLIPLYALGVFTSFTLSQGGMAKRHLRLREQGWRGGLAINGFGAVATAVVTVVIAIVKFSQGAWMMLIAVPVFVFLLVRVNRTYEAEEEELLEGLEALGKAKRKEHIAIVIVENIDTKTMTAVKYALTVGPARVIPVHLARDHEAAAALMRKWALAGPRLRLETVVCKDEGRPQCLVRFVKSKGASRCRSDRHGAGIRASLKMAAPPSRSQLVRVGRASEGSPERQPYLDQGFWRAGCVAGRTRSDLSGSAAQGGDHGRETRQSGDQSHPICTPIECLRRGRPARSR